MEINNGSVFVNNQKLEESYLSNNNDSSNFNEISVPENSYFVLGDNRAESLKDSRNGIMVPASNIIGKVWIRY